MNEEIKNLDEADKIKEIPISYEEKGKEKGEKIGIKKVAAEMLRKDLSVSLISEVTGLSESEIKALKK